MRVTDANFWWICAQQYMDKHISCRMPFLFSYLTFSPYFIGNVVNFCVSLPWCADSININNKICKFYFCWYQTAAVSDSSIGFVGCYCFLIDLLLTTGMTCITFICNMLQTWACSGNFQNLYSTIIVLYLCPTFVGFCNNLVCRWASTIMV